MVHGRSTGNLGVAQENVPGVAVQVGDFHVVGEHGIPPHGKGTVTRALSGDGEVCEGLVMIAGHVLFLSLSK